MDWIASYHALMGEALGARARGKTEAAPEGRLNVKVLRELGVLWWELIVQRKVTRPA